MAVNVTLKEYAKSIGINYECVKKRRQRGWTFDEIKLGERPRGYRFKVGASISHSKNYQKNIACQLTF